MSNPYIVITTKNILAQFQRTQIEVGYIDSNGFLSNITDDCTITVVDGVAEISTQGIYTYILPSSLQSISLRVDYASASDFISLYVIPQALYPTAEDIARIMYAYLPPENYSQATDSAAYAKNIATGEVFSTVYQNLAQMFNDMFPPFSNAIEWQQNLGNGFNWTDSFNYAMVIQIMNSLSVYNPTIYNIEYLISWYIYARLGVSLYVYVQNDNFDPTNTWFLGDSLLGQSTILGPPSSGVKNLYIYVESNALITSTFLNELYAFVSRIITPDLNPIISQISIIYFAQFDLHTFIGDTYSQDPRLYAGFALRYDTKAVYNAKALINPFNSIFLTSFTLIPPFGTFLMSEGTVALQTQATYLVEDVEYILDTTYKTTYTSNVPSVISMSGNIASINGIGAAIIHAHWNYEDTDATYEVVDDLWQLGEEDRDELGVSTILG